MSELISGKEAWIAKSNNECVEWRFFGIEWQELTDREFLSWSSDRFVGYDTRYQFRLKPKKNKKMTSMGISK